MIRTIIRTGTRITAGLALGAIALGLMPAASTHAATTYNADWEISTSCDGGFHWTLNFTNQGAGDLVVDFTASGGNYHRETVPGSTTVTWDVYDDEGFVSYVGLAIDDIGVDQETTGGIVDCVTDGEVTASISLECPEEVDGEIRIRYDFAAPGTGAEFEFDTPDGGTDGLTVADGSTFRTRTVTQGQAVNVSIRNITNGESVVDTFNETVDCPEPMFEDVPGDDNADSDGEGSGAGLPLSLIHI